MSTHFNLSWQQIYRLTLIPLAAVVLYGVTRIVPLGMAALPSSAMASSLPDPIQDSSQDDLQPGATTETAILAGGCFWGMEAVFEHLKGVSNVVSGFSGGTAATANYERVSGGGTDHAEAVQITYDPTQISYGQLLKVYFSVAHDPTQLNRQGPDTGPQYRSEIFFTTDQQRQTAQAYIDQLNRAQVFQQPIVTQLAPLSEFYAADPYHQDFIDRNPDYPYVVIHDLPKLKQLQAQFPNLYQ